MFLLKVVVLWCYDSLSSTGAVWQGGERRQPADSALDIICLFAASATKYFWMSHPFLSPVLEKDVNQQLHLFFNEYSLNSFHYRRATPKRNSAHLSACTGGGWTLGNNVVRSSFSNSKLEKIQNSFSSFENSEKVICAFIRFVHVEYLYMGVSQSSLSCLHYGV